MTSLVEFANFKQNFASFGSKMSYLHVHVAYLPNDDFGILTVELIKFVKSDQIKKKPQFDQIRMNSSELTIL
jgi:hypothetical protein